MTARPDILIFEGLNVLQTPLLGRDTGPTPVASDYFDFSIFVDAKTALIHVLSQVFGIVR